MNKRALPLSLLSALLALGLVSCGGSDAASSSESETVSQSESGEIVIDDIPDITLGESIDLADYVHVPETLDDGFWDYEILSDDVHNAAVESVSSEAPRLGKSTTLQSIRPGIVTIRVTAGDQYAIASFRVESSAQMTDICEYFADNLSVSNFTIKQNFDFDGSSIVAGEKTILMKNENYIYYPEAYYGIAMNKTTNAGYYFQMNGAGDEYASSFHVGVAGDYPTDVTITRGDFDALVEAPGAYWNEDSLAYDTSIAKYFGEEYAIAIPYSSDDEDGAFAKAVELFNLPSYRIMDGYYYFTAAFCPVVTDGELSVYVVFSRSASYISSTSVLAGPYSFEDIGSTSVAVIDSFYEGSAPAALSSNATFTSKIEDITSYTTTCVGQYEDVDGNRIDAPEYFASSLPELDVKTRVQADVGFETTRMDIIDGGEDEHVLLYDTTEGETNVCKKYVLDDDGNYLSVSDYGNDPSSGSKVTKWGSSQTFSSYLPGVIFKETTWGYPKFIKTSESNVYELMAFNDRMARSCIDLIVMAIAGEKISSTSSPFYYYGVYQYMRMDIGSSASSPISGDIYTRVIDGAGTYYIYHFTFSFTDINSTVITAPSAA